MLYEQLQQIFLKLTYILRGYTLDDFDNPNSPAQSLIRLSYQKKSQPFQDIMKDVCYVWINYIDSDTNKLLNVDDLEITDDNISFIKSQLRTIEAHWVFYGDNAQDISFAFRQLLFSNRAKDYLDTVDIKLVPDVPECVLLYEDINNRWWPRVEIVVKYYLETGFTEDYALVKAVRMEIGTDTGKHVVIEG